MSARRDVHPPTEDEVRHAITASTELPIGEVIDDLDDVSAAIDRLSAVAARPLILSNVRTLEGGHGIWEPVRVSRNEHDLQGILWDDLRPSQAERLTVVVGEARKRIRQRVMPIIIEELTAAGVTFAREHPDAPRPEVAA